jgi:uncharacterized repeat protein (TIGR03847 family)
MADDSFEDVLKPAADRIGVEALGEPGSRRFRILAMIDGETHIVWAEKEQVRRMGDALLQVLAALPGGPTVVETPGALPFAVDSRSQFRAGRMELGYEESTGRILIVVHDIEAGPDDAASFVCSISRVQATVLAVNAEAIVSAGRPICPLCGEPMTGDSHACVKQNGHFPHHVEDIEPDIEG